ncbi:MAG: response regulator [Pirellulaceae bacterium]
MLTGIGMTPEHRERLFEPFSQGDAQITEHFGGTGLALRSVSVWPRSRGRISVESTLGVGSTFTVIIAIGDLRRVPLIQPAEMTKECLSDVSMREIRLHGRILIVDDRRDIRFLLKRSHWAGADVAEAEDGLLAIEAVNKSIEQGTHFDLILLDMQMPNLNGYQTAATLRQLGYEKPIVALTADAMQGNMNKCLVAGCNDYLSKPINKQDLLEMVSRFLGS